MSNELINRMQESVDDANTASQITYQVLTGAVDDPVSIDGSNIPTLATRVRDYLDQALDGGDLNGDDGIGIENIEIDTEGHLMVTLTSGSPQDLGEVVPVDGVGVETVSFNSEDGSLEFTLDDGRSITVNDVAGEDGVTVTSADIVSGDLVLTMSDESTINAGDVSQFGGLSASDAEINEQGELVIIFSDGTTENVGRVVGPRGDDGLSTVAGYFDAAGVLRFYRSDGSQYNLGQVIVPILDSTNNTIEGARIDGQNLILELTSGDFDAGRIVGDDGVDGVNIEEIYIDDTDNNLYIRLTGETAQAVGEVRNTIFENADVSVTEAEIVDGELILEVNVNGTSSTRNVGVVVGEDGQIFESATFDDTTNILTLTDTDGNTITVGEIEQNSVSGASIDSTSGELTLTLSDGSTITTDSIRGADGADGLGVDSAYMEDGVLYFTFDEAGIEDAMIGNIIAPVETNAEINTDGNLIVTMSDAQEFDLGRIRGVDGITIENARITDGVLYVDLTDGTTDIEVGSVDKNPTGVSIENDGTLTITFNDDTTLTTTERVIGYDGDTIENISFASNDRDLIIDVSTDNNNNTSKVTIPMVRGRSVENLSVDEANRTISFDTNVEDEGPYEFSFREPVDGDSVTDVRLENDNIIIETNIEGSSLLTIPAPSGLGIESATLDQNNDLLIELTDGTTYTIETIEGYVGFGIEDVRVVDRDLIVELSDGETLTIPAVQGEDGNTITSIYLDNSDLVIENTVDDEPLRFPQIRGEDAINSITDVRFENNDLIIELVDADDVVVPSVQGVDGETITSISFDGNDLIIETTFDSPDDVITIPSVRGDDGLDGATISSGTINSSDELVLTMNDTDSTEYTIPGVGVSVTDASIDESTGQLVFQLSDATELRTTDSVVGGDGDGTGIQSATFTDGALSFELVDSSGTVTTVDAGTVGMNSVVNARIDENTDGSEGVLVFEYEDGTETEVGNVYGRDGRFVSTVEVIDEELILNMSDGSTINSGRVVGDDGLTITDSEVLFSGDLLITYSDGSTENAGNVGSGAGLTVWSVDNTPYVKDRVVIHESGLYISTSDDNNDEPPGGNWLALALGDQLIEVRSPMVQSPIENETAFSVRPRLVASPYAAIVSVDERIEREFQVTLATDTEFTSVVYTATENSDEHELTEDLSVSTDYIWRCRDTSERDYTSSWSDVGAFSVPDGIIEQPTVSINSDEDINATFNAPNFVSSAFTNNFDSQTHTESDWQVINASNDSVVYESLNDAENLESITLPSDVLAPNTNYEIRVKHRGASIESPWSDNLLFTTETEFTYVEKPVVYYDGDIQQVSLFDATFDGSEFRKTDRFLAVSENIAMTHALSEWEVYDADTNTEVESSSTETDLTQYVLSTTLENNVNYRVRVRYSSDRFGSSEWSDWLEFNAEQSIETPTVSTTEDVNGFPSGGVFTGSDFSGINEEHISTDWEVRNFFTDEIAWESLGDTSNLTELSFTESLPDDDYKIRIRYNGNNVSSDWSNSLDFFYGTPE